MPRGRSAVRARSRPGRRPGRLDHDVVTSRLDLLGGDRLDAAGVQQRALVRVTSHDTQPRTRQGEHLRHELSETAGADQQHAVVGAHVDLLEDLERRSQRLGEHGRLVGDGVRHRVEVGERQRHVLGVGAVASGDAEHRPRFAVGRPRVEARLAGAADGVDLADDAAPDPGRVRRLDDLADELVADDARERVVAADELDVGPADARERDADERLAVCLRHGRHRVSTADDLRATTPAWSSLRSALPVVRTRKSGRATPPRRAPRRTGCCTGRRRSRWRRAARRACPAR